jgi:hypothetical protein
MEIKMKATSNKFMRFMRTIVQFVLAMTLLMTATACGAVSFPTTALRSSVPVTIAADQVLATSPGTTMYGIVQALSKMPGTAIFADPGNKTLMFTYPIRDVGQAWATIPNIENGFASFIRATDGSGSVVNPATWQKMLGWLKDGGYKMIEPGAVPAAITAEMALYITPALGAAAARTFPTILAVPIFTLDDLDNLLFPQIGS